MASFIHYFILVLFYISSSASNVCLSDNYYIIRNEHSGLVLDATSPVLLIRHFNGKPAQFWSFECGSKPGLFNIKNKDTGDLLDCLEVAPQKCSTEVRDGSSHQDWYLNSDGSIVNAGKDMFLDIYYANFTEGNFVRLLEGNGSGAQKFLIQKSRQAL